jgi:hypothetical protein
VRTSKSIRQIASIEFGPAFYNSWPGVGELLVTLAFSINAAAINAAKSRFSVQQLRNIRTRLVNHHRNILSLRYQFPIAALYNVTAVLFRFDY